MNTGEIYQLTKRIYKNHRTLIDKLFEIKEDNTSYVRAIFEKKVEDHGYILGSSSRGYVRFLPKSLDEIIPKRKSGWSGNESFLFEIHFTYAGMKKIRFYCTIAPGDDEARNILVEVLQKLQPDYTPPGGKWLTYYDKQTKFLLQDWALKEPEELEEFADDLIQDYLPYIKKVEQAILERKDDLACLRNRVPQSD